MEEIIYTIIKAIAFIIPGSIVTNITRRVIPKSEKEYNEKILEYFIYSFLNFFIWSILIFNIYSNIEAWKQHYIVLWILCFIFKSNNYCNYSDMDFSKRCNKKNMHSF